MLSREVYAGTTIARRRWRGPAHARPRARLLGALVVCALAVPVAGLVVLEHTDVLAATAGHTPRVYVGALADPRSVWAAAPVLGPAVPAPSSAAPAPTRPTPTGATTSTTVAPVSAARVHLRKGDCDHDARQRHHPHLHPTAAPHPHLNHHPAPRQRAARRPAARRT